MQVLSTDTGGGQPISNAPSKPIVFDMESVTVSAQLNSAEELREFIEKLERLEPLMPKVTS